MIKYKFKHITIKENLYWEMKKRMALNKFNTFNKYVDFLYTQEDIADKIEDMVLNDKELNEKELLLKKIKRLREGEKNE